MLAVSSNLQARLTAAADDGLDVVHVVWIDWPAPVGRLFYANRSITIAGVGYAAKLDGAPQVSKSAEWTATNFSALNEAITIKLINTPENVDGDPDAYRVEDLMTRVFLPGSLVRVGVVDARIANPVEADIKWDGLYRVDRPTRGTHRVELYLTDASLQPGEKKIGKAIRDADWPSAPSESYGKVRGPLFGMCDAVPLIPVEVGQVATLKYELDNAETSLELVGELAGWAATWGYIDVDDERLVYQQSDLTNKRLTLLRRGFGFPFTPSSVHAAGTVITELRTGQMTTVSADGWTTLTGASCAGWPLVGCVQIGSEVAYYGSRSGNVLGSLLRGFGYPTVPRAHNAGAVVRTVPVAGTAVRYRYVLALGVATATNFRAIDSEGNETVLNGTAVVSQVTINGTVWTVVDFTERPRVDRYSTSVSVLANEWSAETNGEKDAAGIATLASFLRWRAGYNCTAALVSQIPLALDPKASTQAAILSAGNLFHVTFKAGWNDSGNSPREAYGRFQNAKLKLRLQYSKSSSQTASCSILKDGANLRRDTIPAPPSGSISGGSIGGSQTLPASRWGTATQTKIIKLAVLGCENLGQPYYLESGGTSKGCWVDPRAAFRSEAWSQAPCDGSPNFIAGAWNFAAKAPLASGDSPYNMGRLVLASTESMPSNEDLITGVRVVCKLGDMTNQSGWNGFRARVRLFSQEDRAGGEWYAQDVVRNFADGATWLSIPAGHVWADLQSVEVLVDQYFGSYGCCCGEIQLEVYYRPYVEGQYEPTTVEGSGFFVSGGGGEVPSAIYEHEIGLGSTARAWADANGADPWDFFGGANGADVAVWHPGTDAGLKIAIGDVQLEFEYCAPEAEYDCEVVCDANGRRGTPLGGGGDQALTNAVDVAALLLDSAEFYGLGAYRDAATFVSAWGKSTGILVSRCITEEIELRQLFAELCGENRLLVLFDQGLFQARYRTAALSAADAVDTIGDVADAAKQILADDFVRQQRVDELKNQLCFYYRRNLRTGDFRVNLEVNNATSQATALGVRRDTVDLHWQQSWRGYGSLAGHRAAVQTLADYALSVASTLWDYATVEVPLACGERMQRWDTILVHRPRANLYQTPGRVIQTKRAEGPQRWQLGLQLPPTGASLFWQVSENTYVRYRAGGTELEFVIGGVVVLVIEPGAIRVPTAATIKEAAVLATGYPAGAATGTPTYAFARWIAATSEMLFLRDAGGGVRERVLSVRASGVTVYGRIGAGGGLRTIRTGVDLGGTTSAAAIADTASNCLEFCAGNRVELRVGADRVDVRDLVAQGGM